VPVDPDGLLGPTPKQARGPRWRRVRSGLHVPVTVDAADPEQRTLEAASGLPAFGGVTGWAALRWAGGRWFEDAAPDGSGRAVTLAVGVDNAREVPGVRVSHERLRPDEVVEVDGLRLTDPVRSVLFEVRYAAGLRQAVTAIDMACFSDLVSVAEVRAALPGLTAWTGVEQARRSVELADENAWSPAEVALRLLCCREAGLEGLRSNVPVFDLHGRHVGTPDLIDPETGLVLEYDGALHLTASGRRGDLRRGRGYREVGLEPVVLVAADLRDAGATVGLLHAERGRAAARSRGARRWTLEAPTWWRRTETVEQRRSLTAGQADRLLAHRRAG
jgi:hypothetical protein